MFLDELTWTCDVCGRERPDAKIAVQKFHFVIDGIPLTLHARYCQDSLCSGFVGYARTVRAMEQMAERKATTPFSGRKAETL